MRTMAGIIGQTLMKVNGVFDLDVTNTTWSVEKPVPQQTTGRGIESALGTPKGKINIEEVIARSGAVDWMNLTDFTIDLYDKETRKLVVASFSGCNWPSFGGSSNQGSAEAKRNVTLVANTVNKA
jgi:hypothetical protein